MSLQSLWPGTSVTSDYLDYGATLDRGVVATPAVEVVTVARDAADASESTVASTAAGAVETDRGKPFLGFQLQVQVEQ